MRPKHIGVVTDHGEFELKEYLVRMLSEVGYEVADFGDHRHNLDDDYPNFVMPLARAEARGEVTWGLTICGSGVGACVVASKVPDWRAYLLIHEAFSARQGVEDDDMKMICLGGLVVGHAFAWELVKTFLAAQISDAERHHRRLAKVAALENKKTRTCKTIP
jgi:ribose 5-phosphate isomerase B